MFASFTLKEIGSANPVHVSQDACLVNVLELMTDRHISCVVVVDDKRPIGIFTERDVLNIIATGLDPQVIPVRDVMSGHPVVAPEHLGFFEAYHLCASKNIRHLIIVDGDGNLSGIATDTDFMKVLGVDVLSGQEKVDNLMGLPTMALYRHATVDDAVKLMVKLKTPAVVMVEEDRPIGILTERDLVRIGGASGNGNRLLSEVMTSPVLTVQSDKSIYLAIEMMRERHIRTLAVVNRDGLFQGVLTEHDIVKKIENKYVSALTSIIKRQSDDIERIRQELDEKHVLSAVLHQSLGVSLVVADPGGGVHYINPAAAVLFGVKAEAATGRSLDALYKASDMPTTDLMQSFNAASRGNSYEYELMHHDGAKVQELQIRMAPIQDAGGNFLGVVQTIQDVTEKKNSERKLKQAASIFENTIEGVIIADANVNILSVNPAFTSITGYEEDEVRGKNPRILSSGRQDKAFYERMWGALSTYGYWQGEIWNRRKSGETYAEWLTISAIKDGDGAIKNYIAVFADITSSKRMHDEFEFLAHHDSLTKLPNRLLFNARLEHSLSRVLRTGSLLAVLMVDLDGFKVINDSLGHHAGDCVLESVASRLAASIRSEDTIARLGGDEFVILLEDLVTEEDALEIAGKLITEISQPIALEHGETSLTASIGIAFSSRQDKNPRAILSNADAAMYAAKNAGKNTCRIYE